MRVVALFHVSICYISPYHLIFRKTWVTCPVTIGKYPCRPNGNKRGGLILLENNLYFVDLKGPGSTQDSVWIPGLVFKKRYFGVGLNVQVRFPISIVFKSVHTLNVILAEGTYCFLWLCPNTTLDWLTLLDWYSSNLSRRFELPLGEFRAVNNEYCRPLLYVFLVPLLQTIHTEKILLKHGTLLSRSFLVKRQVAPSFLRLGPISLLPYFVSSLKWGL